MPAERLPLYTLFLKVCECSAPRRFTRLSGISLRWRSLFSPLSRRRLSSQENLWLSDDVCVWHVSSSWWVVKPGGCYLTRAKSGVLFADRQHSSIKAIILNTTGIKLVSQWSVQSVRVPSLKMDTTSDALQDNDIYSSPQTPRFYQGISTRFGKNSSSSGSVSFIPLQ